MEFDKSRVYTALNADKLKVGSKVIVSNCISDLKGQVEANSYPTYIRELINICSESSLDGRFETVTNLYHFAYLISEPEEEVLKWTDLKVGDVIRNGEFYEMITSIHKNEGTDRHVFVQGKWISDEQLKNWEKVEK